MTIVVNRDMVDTMIFRNSKNFMEENAIAGLDELARVTVSNDNEPQYEVRLIKLPEQMSHFKTNTSIHFVGKYESFRTI